MRIGELAHRTAVSERLLRYYEEQQLLRPMRAASGYRHYAESDVETVRRIRQLLAAGLGTATIAQILPCVQPDGDRLTPACPTTVRRIRREHRRISDRVDELQTSLRLLEDVLGEAPG